MNPVSGALDYLSAQSFDSLLALFWFVILFEVPRYLLAFIMVAFTPRRRPEADPSGRVSVIVAGYSEDGVIDACVAALREQSRPPDEIVVVSDGSTDGMARRIARMQRDGLIDRAYATDLRSGKAAGANLAARQCTGDFIVNVDCDCSFDRHALRNVLRPLSDPAVGAVSGSILPRNGRRSVLASFQAIEYMISISLGKQAADRLGQVSCVSGAFGAFRRSAFDGVGGHDAGGGEDLDLTLSLRNAGWGIRFADDALCYTDVPETRAALVRQRFRWERDSVRLRYRKHGTLMNPFALRFTWRELLHELEFLFFNVAAAVAMPFYIVWLVTLYEGSAAYVLLAAQFGVLAVDGTVFALAASVTPKANGWRLVPYVVGYSMIYSVYMRFIRLAAYVEEWVFRASYNDTFVPGKVHRVRG